MDFINTYWEYISIGVLVYFLPTLISLFNKKSKSFGIFLINLFTGWTVIMWISLFFESFRDPSISRTGGGYQDDGDDGDNESNSNYSEDRISNHSSGQKLSNSQSRNPDQKISNSQSNKFDELETIEIQGQQNGGNWRTLHSSTQKITNNSSLDQTISRQINSVENIISKQSGFTGKVRARGKKTGTIYDINM
jgi:hypothetical protein